MEEESSIYSTCMELKLFEIFAEIHNINSWDKDNSIITLFFFVVVKSWVLCWEKTDWY